MVDLATVLTILRSKGIHYRSCKKHYSKGLIIDLISPLEKPKLLSALEDFKVQQVGLSSYLVR